MVGSIIAFSSPKKIYCPSLAESRMLILQLRLSSSYAALTAVVIGHLFSYRFSVLTCCFDASQNGYQQQSQASIIIQLSMVQTAEMMSIYENDNINGK